MAMFLVSTIFFGMGGGRGVGEGFQKKSTYYKHIEKEYFGQIKKITNGEKDMAMFLVSTIFFVGEGSKNIHRENRKSGKNRRGSNYFKKVLKWGKGGGKN